MGNVDDEKARRERMCLEAETALKKYVRMDEKGKIGRDRSLGEDVCGELVREALKAFRGRMEEKGADSVGSPGGWIKSTFRHLRADWFNNQPQAEGWDEITLTAVPPGLEELVGESPGFLRLRDKRLGAAPLMPRDIYAALCALSDDAVWLREAKKLHGYSWKPRETRDEEVLENLEAHDRVDAKERMRLALDPFNALWRMHGGKAARDCIELFADSVRAEILLERQDGQAGTKTRGESARMEATEREESARMAAKDREDLARDLGKESVEALNKQVSRCYGLARKALLRLTQERPDGEDCRRRFVLLWGEEGGKRPTRRRFQEAAAALGEEEAEFRRRHRDCLDRLLESLS